MAQSKLATEKALQKLSDQLTCSVCLENYREPRVLPCLHAFCKMCLERLVSRDGTSLTCPNCRRTTRVPQGGVSTLQSAFYIHHLVDVRDTLEKVKDAKTACEKCEESEAKGYCRNCGKFVCKACITVHKKWKEYSSHEIATIEEIQSEAAKLLPPKRVTMNCQKHPSEQLKIYCETCEQLVCRDCTVKAHRDHQYDLAGDCFPKHRDAITASLQPVKQQLGIVNQAVAEMDARSKRLNEQGDTIKRDIQTAIDQLHDTLETRKRDLIAQVDQMVKQTGKTLQSQREGYELAQTQLFSCLEIVEESLRTGSREEILSMKKQVVERVNEMEKEFEPRKYQPEPEQVLQFAHQHLVESCQRFGEVHMRAVCPEKCYATGEGAQRVLRGEMATLTLFTVDKDGKECVDRNIPITGDLVCRSDGTVVHCEVVEKRKNSYVLRYLPHSRGQHDLHIRVGGTHISDSPMVMRVVVGFRGTHMRTIKEVKRPRHLAITGNGEVVVAEQNAQCVSVFDCEGHKLRSFGEQPLGVALCNDNTVLVTSNHRVKRFTLDGQLIASVGTSGSGHLQFDIPWSVATSPTKDKVYVCDTHNHRIQVLNSDFTFSSTFGSKGNNPGQFDHPVDIAVNKDGNIFVADWFNNRIQVFSPSGQFIRQFQELGPDMGKLDYPVSVCIDCNDFVYVLEGGKCRVSIFDTKGNYIISYFGKKEAKPGELKSPYGIAVDKEGYIYISDSRNNRIQIFE